MGPGGLHGLQICCSGSFLPEGGFDSLALPPSYVFGSSQVSPAVIVGRCGAVQLQDYFGHGR